MRVMGIDPGLKGGLALLSADGLLIERMPVFKVDGKETLDALAIKRLILDWDPQGVVVEKQMVLPGQGSTSGSRTGFHFGLLVGLIQALNLPITLVGPKTWKRAMACPADKDGARYRASQLFPDHADSWRLKRDDGLAEAAIIALYGRTTGAFK